MVALFPDIKGQKISCLGYYCFLRSKDKTKQPNPIRLANWLKASQSFSQWAAAEVYDFL